MTPLGANKVEGDGPLFLSNRSLIFGNKEDDELLQVLAEIPVLDETIATGNFNL